MRQNYRFQLLAPPQTRSNSAFRRSKIDEHVYYQRLASLQRLRARVYLRDGAIQPWQVDEDGLFQMPLDEQSWHFLLVDDKQEVIGCVRYLVHPNTVSFHKLRICQSALARDPQWREKVQHAVETDLKRAREERLSYLEVGGWALAEAFRGTSAALEILVASYALGHLLGGCLGSCTATVRHCSSSILRRIGGSSFHAFGEALPPYKDPQYGCEMELLRFDSRSPAQRFMPFINRLKAKLANTLTIVPARSEVFGKPRVEIGAEHVGFLGMVPLH